jgi:hypothetical protein
MAPDLKTSAARVLSGCPAVPASRRGTAGQPAATLTAPRQRGCPTVQPETASVGPRQSAFVPHVPPPGQQAGHAGQRANAAFLTAAARAAKALGEPDSDLDHERIELAAAFAAEAAGEFGPPAPLRGPGRFAARFRRDQPQPTLEDLA